MRDYTISGLLAVAASLLGLTPACADMFRCVGADGNTLFTNIACPSGMKASTIIITSAAVCTTEGCQHRRDLDAQEAAERLRAEKEQLAIYAEDRHKKEQEEPPLEGFQTGQATTPTALAGHEPLDGTAYPVYPVLSVPLTCGHHCAPLSHYWQHRTGQHDNRDGDRSDGHHRQHRMGEPDRDRFEGRPSDWDRHHPMRDPKDRHEDLSVKHDRHDPTAQPGGRHDHRLAEEEEPNGASRQHSSRQVGGPRQRLDDGPCRDRLRCAAQSGGRWSNAPGKS